MKTEGDEVIEVKKNEEFTIELDSNPTTGYGWEAKFNKNSIELIRKEFELSSDKIGAGGKERFYFIAQKSGETMVKMIYKRPWEDKTIKTRSLIIQIK